ncbi:DNA-binding transcriptional MerR regulator [Micromonospora pisi]|uniref:DNA-binding transcriptional MerR regulator n=1 Tax=Micromonospora pisi TaxID=589240 RepID=A0A495JGQ9_9ACTN|nr:MerR family transcriptional regulator [Micromonospora pisi]RKR87574.1 DNA-binding transcriptional MerR regulator [Micromonospora pisi]
MFSIGDFAKVGRVSVRMLRHYDAIGLLRPAVVDPTNGYRFYHADQLRRLNRVIALKDLGFTLQQVQAVLDDQLDVEELRGMLRLQRAELAARLAADAARLTGIEARLRMIENEGHMHTEDVVLKKIAPVRVAELSAVAASYEAADIGPVIQPLYPEVIRRVDAAGVAMIGPSVAYYEPAPGEPGEAVVVHAGVAVAVAPQPGHDFAIVDLPAIESAATIIHRGSMDEADRSMQILARWVEENGYRMIGYAREVCLEFVPDQPDQWVHEFQVEVSR